MNHSISYWEQRSFFDSYDVLIIGSGLVGLNAAISLKELEPGLKVGILERGLIPSGASTKNAGFACFGSISELIEQLAKSSEEELLNLIEYRWKGLLKLRERVGDNQLDYQNLGGYELFQTEKKELFEECCNKLDYFNGLVRQVIGTDSIYSIADNKIDSFGFKNVEHLIFNKCESQIDTGQMMQSLLRKAQGMGVIIINKIAINKLVAGSRGIELYAAGGEKFFSKKVIAATNAFAKQLFPELDVLPGRGQVLITKPIKSLKIKGAFHYDKGYYYFRNIHDRVLFGGGRNLDFKAEETDVFGETDQVMNKLKELLNTMILPDTPYEIDMQWSGIMGFGKELSPIIKEISPGIFCAIRCNGMGVAMGSLIGDKVAKMVLESYS